MRRSVPCEWELGGYINGGFLNVNWYFFLSRLVNACHMVDHSKKKRIERTKISKKAQHV